VRWTVLPSSARCVTAIFFGAVFGLAGPQLHGQTRPSDTPGVHVERVDASMIYVSVANRNLTIAQLIRWARQVQAANQADWRGRIGFFTSKRAARTFTTSLAVEPPPHFTESSREFLAFHQVEDGKEYLTVQPFGFFVDFKDVQVPIGSSQTPLCGYHLAGRCLLGMETLGSVAKAIKGSVTVEGRIARRGKLEGIRVVEARAEQANQREQLVRAVQANAKTWWLESAAGNDSVRITFLFGNAEAAPVFVAPELALETPDHVRILASASNGR
jgi:hypothetical protein